MRIGVLKIYYVLFLFLAFGVVISFSFQNGVRLYPYDLPVLIISPISVLYLWRLRRKLADVKYLLLFLLTGFLGLFFFLSSVTELLDSLAYLVRIALYLLLAVPILFFSKTEIKKVSKVIVLSGLLFVLLGFMQYVFYNDLANLYYLGWDRHLYRFFSTFLDPNFAGIYVVLLFVTTLLYIQMYGPKKKAKWMLLVVCLYVSAIFLTYSRTTYIMFLVTISLYISFFNKKLVAVFLILFFTALILLPKNFGGEGVNLLRTSSIFARLEASEVAYTIFIKNPVLGVGFNAFKFAQLREGVLPLQQINSHAASGVPNSYLLTLATTGVVGFFFLARFIFHILKSLLHDVKENIFARGAFSILIGILVASLFENALFYSPILIFLIILATISLRWEIFSRKSSF